MGIQINGSLNTISSTSSQLKLGAVSTQSEFINALGNTGITPNIDLSISNFVTATLNQNATFTFSNVPTQAVSFVLFLYNDSTPNRTITWPAAVRWPNSTLPVRTTAANKMDVYVFTTLDGGAVWYGTLTTYNYA